MSRTFIQGHAKEKETERPTLISALEEVQPLSRLAQPLKVDNHALTNLDLAAITSLGLPSRTDPSFVTNCNSHDLCSGEAALSSASTNKLKQATGLDAFKALI